MNTNDTSAKAAQNACFIRSKYIPTNVKLKSRKVEQVNREIEFLKFIFCFLLIREIFFLERVNDDIVAHREKTS